jgi:hypothetical protein
MPGRSALIRQEGDMWLLRAVRMAGALLLAAIVAHASASAKPAGQDAAGCLALVGGPTGQLAAQLAKNSSAADIQGAWSKAGETAANYAKKKCEAFVQDYVFLAIAAAVTALVADGQLPKDYTAAQAQLDGYIGQIIASLLADPNSPLAAVVQELGKLMPAEWMKAFTEAAMDSAKEGAKEKIAALWKEAKEKITDAVPILALFLNYFDCAVIVATGGAADQVKQVIDTYEGCAQFLATCTQSLGDCIGSVAELGQAIGKGIADLPGAFVDAVAGAFNGAAAAIGAALTTIGEAVNCGLVKCTAAQSVPPNDIYPPCQTGWVPGQPYQWTDADGKIHNEIASPACVCGPAMSIPGSHNPVAYGASGTVMMSDGVGGYACGCADKSQGYQAGAGCTACPGGQVRCDGSCGPPAVIQQASFGWDDKTKSWGKKTGNKVSVSIMQGDTCQKRTCTCGLGDKPVVDTATGACSCASACQPGSIYPQAVTAALDPTLMDGTFCHVCPANHRAEQGLASGKSTALSFETVDQCTPCADDESAPPGSAQCIKLACPAGSLAKAHQCVPCAGAKCAVAIAKPDEPKGPAPLRKRVQPTCPKGMEMRNGKCRMPPTRVGIRKREGIDEFATNPAVPGARRPGAPGFVGNPLQPSRIPATVRAPGAAGGTPALVRGQGAATGTPALARQPAAAGTPAFVRTPAAPAGTPALVRTPSAPTPTAPPAAPNVGRKF